MPDTISHDDDAEHYIMTATLLNAVRGQLLRVQHPDTYALWLRLSHAEPVTSSRFENTYECNKCGRSWTDIWTADDVQNECECGNRHLEPIASVELVPIEYHRRPAICENANTKGANEDTP
jgi:hypothetical protein